MNRSYLVDLPASEANSKSKTGWWESVLRMVTMAGSLTLVLSWLGRFHWMADLASHLTLHLLLVVWIGSFILLRTRSWLLGTLALLFTLTYTPQCIALLWPSSFGLNAHPHASGQHPLRFISCNVWTSNPNKAGVTQYLRDSNADIVLVMEVNREWRKALEELNDVYPHQFIIDREDNFGIGYLCRMAPGSVRVHHLDASAVPSIDMTINVGDRSIRMIGTHPLPPIGAEYTKQRNQHLAALASLLAHGETPTIVMGDLNCTSWSGHFRDLLAGTELRDSRLGFGFLPTWPSSMGPLGIAIDHALVSTEWRVVERKVGPPVGSDHRPMECVVELVEP